MSKAPAENRNPERPRGRPFPKGHSGNPGGRPKSIATLEREIRDAHGPMVMKVLDKLRDVALAGDVPAAKLYLDRVLGPARAAAEADPPRIPAFRDVEDTIEVGVGNAHRRIHEISAKGSLDPADIADNERAMHTLLAARKSELEYLKEKLPAYPHGTSGHGESTAPEAPQPAPQGRNGSRIA